MITTPWKLASLLIMLLLCVPAFGLQMGTTLRTNRAAVINSTIGAAPILELFSGAKPANCGSSDPAGAIVNITLPSAWLGSASGGVISKSGTWSGTATGNGTAASWRIYDSSGATCYMQGNVTAVGAGGDITLDNPAIVSSQTVTISSFSITEGNALLFPLERPDLSAIQLGLVIGGLPPFFRGN